MSGTKRAHAYSVEEVEAGDKIVSEEKSVPNLGRRLFSVNFGIGCKGEVVTGGSRASFQPEAAKLFPLRGGGEE